MRISVAPQPARADLRLIVLTAIAIVYFYVAPQLEARCATRSSTGSPHDAARYSAPLRQLVGTDATQPRARAPGAGRRTAHEREVTCSAWSRGDRGLAVVLADSDTGGVEIDDMQSVAQTALATGRTARATEPTRRGRQALVAEPLIEGGRVRGSWCSPTRWPTCRATSP